MRNFIFKEMSKLNTIRRFAMVRWLNPRLNHIAQIRRNIREVMDIIFVAMEMENTSV